MNPHRSGHTPGGSSGGSGAAVAAGLCAAALGTDTLGSVRIPAAYSGVYGLKPTNGLVPDAGLVPLSRRLDAIGPLARSVDDLRRVMAALAPLSPAEPAAKVALLGDVDRAEMDGAVSAAYRLAADLLGGLGLSVQTYAAPEIDPHRIRLAGFVEAARDAQALYGADIERVPDDFSEVFRSHLTFAGGFDAAAVAQGRSTLDAAAARLRAVLADAEVILLPTAPQAAFAHGGSAPVNQADFTALANIAGLPALSLPAGWTSDGLPVAVQLVGRPNAEAALLDLAERLDAALNAYSPPADFD
jgi:aspartyl-tRNA(Asn)/glutamyl-tRNA(Gln) amidotransferase subunit A